jgi:hypothetical protein
MKQRNPRYGCPRTAQQINLAFGLELDKDTVRKVLAVCLNFPKLRKLRIREGHVYKHQQPGSFDPGIF